jgi:hypothetical protein
MTLAIKRGGGTALVASSPSGEFAVIPWRFKRFYLKCCPKRLFLWMLAQGFLNRDIAGEFPSAILPLGFSLVVRCG